MANVTQISLESLLLRATNPNNTNLDSAAVEAFFALVNKERDGSAIGVKVIASRLPVGTEKEVISTLNVLDMCMSRCGAAFQNEVGKFSSDDGLNVINRNVNQIRLLFIQYMTENPRKYKTNTIVIINGQENQLNIGVKVIASRLPVGTEKEVISTLNVLDMCMSRCGAAFQNEVGKFRFLNEMIKLVSPKYFGSKTPLSVKQRVLQLLYLWTLDYPKEVKIKEAFDMLRKQGVIREIPNPNIPQEALGKHKII